MTHVLICKRNAGFFSCLKSKAVQLKYKYLNPRHSSKASQNTKANTMYICIIGH